MNSLNKIHILATFSLIFTTMAVPATALEHEFHGSYKLRANVSNYEDGNPGYMAPSKDPRTKTYVEQRGRITYTGKVDNELKMVTTFEIDSRFGDNSYNGNGTTRNNGGAVGADQVNIETKSLYLDYTINDTPAPINAKLGIQPFTDAFKGIIFGNDGAGLVLSSKINGFNTRLGLFRFYDNLTTNLAPAGNANGNLTQDFVNLDGGYKINENLKVGASYMLLYDDRSRSTETNKVIVHMLGINAEAKLDDLLIDGFFIYQTGRAGLIADPSAVGRAGAPQPFKSVNAFAANFSAKKPIGPGTAKLNAIYISGDDTVNGSGSRSDFITIRGTEHNLYSAEMMILLRSKHAINSDRAIVYNLNNANQGLIGGFLGYDIKIDKFFSNTNVGFAAVAANTSKNKSDFMGTEINTEIGFKPKTSLTTSIQAAYVILGDYFAKTGTGGANPDNPYTARLVVTYSF